MAFGWMIENWGLTKQPPYDTIKIPKDKELKTMYIFEIRNRKTNAAVTTAAKTYNQAIKNLKWRPQDCRLCWKCPV
jgi:hypothetical protein